MSQAEPPVESGVSRTTTPEERYIMPLLPTERPDFDPIRVLHGVQTVIQSAPDTAQSIQVRSLEETLGQSFKGEYANITPFFEMAGSWELDSGWRYRPRYMNPDYMHPQAIPDDALVTETDAREDVIERCARYGTVTQGDLAVRFGISEQSLTQFIWRKNIDWQQYRAEGLDRLARTLWLLFDEIGYETSTLAAALDLSPHYVRDLYQRCDRKQVAAPTDVSASYAPTLNDC